MKQALKIIFAIILTLGLTISFQSLLAAWTPPTQPPVNGNVGLPVFTSTTTKQYITGGGGMQTDGDFGANNIVALGYMNVNSNLIVDTNTLYVDSTGNRVGIGVIPSSERLEIANNGNIRLGTGVGNYGAGRVQAFSSGDIIGYTMNSNTRVWDLISIVSTNPDYFAIRDNTAGVNRLAISELGFVGINTSNPSARLQVDHVSNTSPAGYFRNSSGEGLRIQAGAGASTYPVLNAATYSGTSLFYVRGDGNVGIGNTSPATKLQVMGDITLGENNTGNSVRMDTADGSDNSWIGIAGGGAANDTGRGAFLDLFGNEYSSAGLYGTAILAAGLQTAGSGGNILLNTNGYNRVIIDYNGLVTMNEGLRVGNHSNDYTYITLMDDDESLNGVKYIHANSNVIGFLGGAGSWLAYWTAAGNQITTGSVTATAYYCSSDERLKKDITIIDDALLKINDINGVNFKWADQVKGSENQVGVIAQDVEKVLPEIVSTDSEGYKTIDYSKLTPLIIEAVKELDQKTDGNQAGTEKEITYLKEQIRLLQLEIQNLKK